MSNEILSEIRLELDKFKADLKEAQKAGEDTAKKTGESMGDGIEGGLSKMLGGLKGQFLALAGVVAGAFTFKEAISAASEQENAINSLNSALALSGHYTAQASQSFLDFASALQKTTVSADEAIIQGGALLATLGKLSGDTLNRATQASLDLAAALNIDQAQAFMIVSKAASGHVEMLKRYGIEVKKTGSDSADFANALTTLEGRFKGLAQLQTNTFSGAMMVTKNQFGEILESIGNIIIQSPTMIAVLKTAAKSFETMATGISEFAKNRDLIGEMAKALVGFAADVNTYLVVPLELAFNLIRTGALTIATAFTGLISVVGLLGSAISESLIAPVVNFIGGALGKLISLVDKDLGASLTAFVTQATESTTTGLKTIGENAALATQKLADDTAAASAKVFDFNVAQTTENYITKADEFFSGVTPVVLSKFQEMSDAANQIPQPTFFTTFAESFRVSAMKMSENAKNLGAAIQATINTGVTNSFAAMGAAMVKGENGMAAFGKAMLGVLGDIAIQFGTTFIAMGVAKTLLFDPTGPLLIAAGAALAAIGGALKAVSGGSGAATGAPATPSEGGGVAANAGTGVSPAGNQATAFNDTQRGEVGTKVEVHVQGNVFDRRETGLMIADTINEVFGSNGITLATGGA